MYGEGISRVGDILDMAVALGIIQKSGSWFSYEGERLGQGRDNVKQYLKDTPEMAEAIENIIRDMVSTSEDDLLETMTDINPADE